jgi:superfamily I DNA and RNA helicase
MIWICHIPLLLLSFAVLGHLTSQKQTEGIAVMETAPTSTIQVAFQTIAKGNRSGVREFLQQVTRNQTEWATLWQRHIATETNPLAPPVVDFNKEFVIAIFLGEKPTGGYAVEMTFIERKDRDLVVSYKEFQPAPGAMTTQALTQPFHMVRVAKNGEPNVMFRRES